MELCIRSNELNERLKLPFELPNQPELDTTKLTSLVTIFLSSSYPVNMGHYLMGFCKVLLKWKEIFCANRKIVEVGMRTLLAVLIMIFDPISVQSNLSFSSSNLTENDRVNE